MKKKLLLIVGIALFIFFSIFLYKKNLIPLISEQSNDIHSQIQKVITTGNSIEPFLAETVRLEIDGTECCGDLSKMEFLKQFGGGGVGVKVKYNFDQNNESIKRIRSDFPKYFEKHIIGTYDGMGMSYRLNSNKKINFISYFTVSFLRGD